MRGSLNVARIFSTKTGFISKITSRVSGLIRSRINRVITPSPGPNSTTVFALSGSILLVMALHKNRELGETLPVNRRLRILSRRNSMRCFPKFLQLSLTFDRWLDPYPRTYPARSGYFLTSATASAFVIRIPLI